MAKYTTELRSICEVYAGYSEQQGLSNVDDVIAKALPKLFDFDFPIYDESYRNVLETKIVKHYYTREIGAETVGRWKLFLNERLNLIMPYYNQRYKSTLLDFNPLYDVDLTTDHTKDNGGNSNSTNDRTYNRKDDYTRNLKSNTNAKSNDDNWQYYSDTPQGGVQGLADHNYLTNATNDVNSGTDNSETNLTGTDSRTIGDTDNSKGNAAYTDTESYLEHVKGKTAGTSFSRLVEEYRKTFVNIDNEIIENLGDLFLNLW